MVYVVQWVHSQIHGRFHLQTELLGSPYTWCCIVEATINKISKESFKLVTCNNQIHEQSIDVLIVASTMYGSLYIDRKSCWVQCITIMYLHMTYLISYIDEISISCYDSVLFWIHYAIVPKLEK